MDQTRREALRVHVRQGHSAFKPAGHFQTMRVSFEEICLGQSPWIPLGNFMNDWYASHLMDRARLVADPLPTDYSQAFHTWAAFCAASVRWFCSTYEIPCPHWVEQPEYVLPEPWYIEQPVERWPSLRATTAEEFTQHNIYCGNQLYINKYERDEEGRWLQAHPIDVLERRKVARQATARLLAQQTERERWRSAGLALSRAFPGQNELPQ